MITVSDLQNGTTSALPFSITENVPSLSASVGHGRSLQNFTVAGQVFDQSA
jgi:hypothetical protein